ncbi:MAG: hypothetical protein PVJ80_05455 [Gemmatimonadota bacterium]|jgi:hypothetical protein
MTTRGYLTMAARNPRFLEMAVDMALSLREHTDLPVAIAVDEPLAAIVNELYPRVFDEVSLIPPRFRTGRSLKYGSAEASPFEETAFVDADCILLGNTDDVFASLESADVAMIGEQLTTTDDVYHHGFSTSYLIRRFGLEQYLKTNSGFFCFRRSTALEIMEECRVCYLEEVLPKLRWSRFLGRWLGDELAFGIIGGRRDLGTLPKPDHMLWPNEIRRLNLANPEKALLHMIWPPAPATLDALLSQAATRRTEAGVPGEVETHWRDEVKKLRRMALRQRLLNPLGRPE